MSMSSWFKQLFQDSPGRVVGAILGFVCALFVLLIGFLSTLLIILCTLFGFFIACLAESGWNLAACLKRLRGENQHDED